MLFHSGRDDRRYDPVSGEVLPEYRVSHEEYTVEEKLGLARQAEPPSQSLRTFEFFTVAPTREGTAGTAQKTVREAVEPRTQKPIKLFESVKSILEMQEQQLRQRSSIKS